MLWVNGQKYENLLQFNTSWLASLRTWYILDFVLASVIVAITLYLNVPPFSLRSCYTPWKRQKGFLIPEYFLGYWLKLCPNASNFLMTSSGNFCACANYSLWEHLDLTDQKLLAKLTTYTFLILRLLVRHKVEAFKLMNHDIRNTGKLHTFPTDKMYWIEKAIEKR